MTTILIVEDEARIAAFVAKGLRAAGFVIAAVIVALNLFLAYLTLTGQG